MRSNEWFAFHPFKSWRKSVCVQFHQWCWSPCITRDACQTDWLTVWLSDRMTGWVMTTPSTRNWNTTTESRTYGFQFQLLLLLLLILRLFLLQFWKNSTNFYFFAFVGEKEKWLCCKWRFKNHTKMHFEDSRTFCPVVIQLCWDITLGVFFLFPLSRWGLRAGCRTSHARVICNSPCVLYYEQTFE